MSAGAATDVITLLPGWVAFRLWASRGVPKVPGKGRADGSLTALVCGELFLKSSKRVPCLGKVLFHVVNRNQKIYLSVTITLRPSFSPHKYRAMVS